MYNIAIDYLKYMDTISLFTKPGHEFFCNINTEDINNQRVQNNLVDFQLWWFTYEVMSWNFVVLEISSEKMSLIMKNTYFYSNLQFFSITELQKWLLDVTSSKLAL